MLNHRRTMHWISKSRILKWPKTTVITPYKRTFWIEFFQTAAEMKKVSSWKSNGKQKLFILLRKFIYSSDSRRSQIARRKIANKQISLANQGLTRSFHWWRAISKTSFFIVFFEFLTHLQFFDFKKVLTEKFSQTFRIWWYNFFPRIF